MDFSLFLSHSRVAVSKESRPTTSFHSGSHCSSFAQASARWFLELEFEQQDVAIPMHYTGVNNVAICDGKCCRTGFCVQVPSRMVSCASATHTRTHRSAERVFKMGKMW